MSKSVDDLPDIYCGMFCDCPAFREYIENFFELWQIKEEMRYWFRDLLSGAWNAGVDTARGIKPTPEERRARAEAIDAKWMDRNEP